jgi:hypothetical protein
LSIVLRDEDAALEVLHFVSEFNELLLEEQEGNLHLSAMQMEETLVRLGSYPHQLLGVAHGLTSFLLTYGLLVRNLVSRRVANCNKHVQEGLQQMVVYIAGPPLRDGQFLNQFTKLHN